MRFDRVIAIRNNKTIYRDGDRCIKVFRSGYSPAAVMREAFHQVYVRELGVTVPQLLTVAPYREEWAIEMQYIRGKTLAQMTDSPDVLCLFAEMHAKIHEKTASDLQNQRDVVRRSIECGLSHDPAVRDAYITETEKLERSGNLCHGDFCLSNVLLGGDGELYVIDWPHAVQGDPCLDAAITYLHLTMDCGTEAAEVYLSEYTRITGREKKRIRSFFGMAAATLMADCSMDEKTFFGQYL